MPCLGRAPHAGAMRDAITHAWPVLTLTDTLQRASTYILKIFFPPRLPVSSRCRRQSWWNFSGRDLLGVPEEPPGPSCPWGSSFSSIDQLLRVGAITSPRRGSTPGRRLPRRPGRCRESRPDPAQRMKLSGREEQASEAPKRSVRWWPSGPLCCMMLRAKQTPCLLGAGFNNDCPSESNFTSPHSQNAFQTLIFELKMSPGLPS